MTDQQPNNDSNHDSMGRATRIFDHVQPINLRRLREVFDGNGAAAGRALGLTGGTVTKHLATNETLRVYELAAEQVLSTMDAQPKTDSEAVGFALDAIAVYFENTPALDVPTDLFALLGQSFVDVLRSR